jgi:hypothetical protein
MLQHLASTYSSPLHLKLHSTDGSAVLTKAAMPSLCWHHQGCLAAVHNSTSSDGPLSAAAAVVCSDSVQGSWVNLVAKLWYVLLHPTQLPLYSHDAAAALCAWQALKLASYTVQQQQHRVLKTVRSFISSCPAPAVSFWPLSDTALVSILK